MFQTDRLILRTLHQSFEIERPKGHWSEVEVHLYKNVLNIHSAKVLSSHIRPFKPNGISHSYQLNQSISVLMAVGL